jgi:hypothetical protein
MQIVYGYDLPFRVSVVTTPDPALRIRVGCRHGTTSEDLARVETHGATFIEAALFGMGAGARIAPRLGKRPIDKVLRVALGREGLALEAHVTIDPSYVVILLNKLLCLSDFVGVEDVAVELPGLASVSDTVPILRRDASELPEIHPQLPFEFVDERSGYSNTRTVLITYADPPSDSVLGFLRQGLQLWTTQALQGAYISPPMGPADYFVSTDDSLEVLDNEVSWSMEDFRLDLDGMNAIVNFLAAYHGQVAALREVLLE